MTAPLFPVMTGSLPPAPYARKPSIVDRVAARLFPMAQYSGLLSPEDQAGIQHQGLLSLGANLLRASGPTTVPTSFGQAVGNALGGVDMNQMVDRALQLKAYRTELDQQRALAAAGAAHPSQPGETREQAYNRLTSVMTDLLAIPGGDAAAAKLAPVLAALKPDRGLQPQEPQKVEHVTDNRLGSPTIGKTGTFLIPYPNAPSKDWTFLPEGERAHGPAGQQQLQHAEFGAAALAAWQPVERLRQRNPGVEQEVGKIFVSPDFAKAVPFFKSSADAVAAVQRAGGSPAAQQYMRAKWSFLDNILRTRYATGRLGGPMLAQMAQEFLPSLDTEGNAQVRQNEIQAILTAQGESGFDENPDIWNRAVKRHGVANLDLQSILSGGGADNRINQMQQRY